jgi:hypothetical protein
MIAILIIAIAMAVMTTSLSLQSQLIETAKEYREEIQIDAVNRFFMPIRDHADHLGIWPNSKTELIALAHAMGDDALVSLIEDNPENPYSRYIGYASADVVNGPYEIKRGMLYYVDPDTLSHDDADGGFLDASRNPCGGDYKDGDAWCPPIIADADYTFYRSSGDRAQGRLMLQQEARLKRLAQRIGNFMSYNDAEHPDTSAVIDEDKALYDLVTLDQDGNTPANLDPATNPCEGGQIYFWDGMPIACQDLFSQWHVDTERLNRIDPATMPAYESAFSLTSVQLKDRFHSPIRVFDNGSVFLLYVHSPFNRKNELEPAYIYVDLTL